MEKGREGGRRGRGKVEFLSVQYDFTLKVSKLPPCASLKPKVLGIRLRAWCTAGLRYTSSSISSGSGSACSCVVLQLTCLPVPEDL